MNKPLLDTKGILLDIRATNRVRRSTKNDDIREMATGLVMMHRSMYKRWKMLNSRRIHSQKPLA